MTKVLIILLCILLSDYTLHHFKVEYKGNKSFGLTRLQKAIIQRREAIREAKII